MTAFVHIGLAKTGSTTIQAFLEQNAEALRDRGVRYERYLPKIGSQLDFAVAARARTGKMIPHDIMRDVLDLHDRAQQKSFGAAFEADLARRRATWTEPLCVISSEHLGAWLNTPEQVGALMDILGAHFDDVKVVVYLRRQEELVLSSYSEKIKRGSHDDFETHLAARMESDHLRLVRLWRRAVGPKNLVVRLLEPDVLKNGDLIEDFCNVIGVDSTGLVRPDPQNESLSAVAAEFLRRLNGRAPWLTTSRLGRRVRGALLRRLMRRSEGFPRHKLSQAQLDRIRAANAHSNAQLCRRYFPERDELFPRRDERLVDPTFERPDGSLPALALRVFLSRKTVGRA